MKLSTQNMLQSDSSVPDPQLTKTVRRAMMERWVFTHSKREMTHCWELRKFFGFGRSIATVYSSGVWWTWDKDGNGGENSKEEIVEIAKAVARKSAYFQRF